MSLYQRCNNFSFTLGVFFTSRLTFIFQTTIGLHFQLLFLNSWQMISLEGCWSGTMLNSSAFGFYCKQVGRMILTAWTGFFFLICRWCVGRANSSLGFCLLKSFANTAKQHVGSCFNRHVVKVLFCILQSNPQKN